MNSCHLYSKARDRLARMKGVYIILQSRISIELGCLILLQFLDSIVLQKVKNFAFAPRGHRVFVVHVSMKSPMILDFLSVLHKNRSTCL